jgi:ATP synthase regulation protein NCA2
MYVQVTLQAIAAVPAVLIIGVLYVGARNVWYSISSRKLEPTALVHANIRASVREIERLLVSSKGFTASNYSISNNSNNNDDALLLPHTASEHEHERKTSDIREQHHQQQLRQQQYSSSSSNSNSVLDAAETGCLLLQLHSLQLLLHQNASRFDTRTRQRLLDDMRDLTKSDFTVAQQIATLQRMVRTYSFLQQHREGRRVPINIRL